MRIPRQDRCCDCGEPITRKSGVWFDGSNRRTIFPRCQRCYEKQVKYFDSDAGPQRKPTWDDSGDFVS